MGQVRKAADEERKGDVGDESSMGRLEAIRDEDDELQLIEDSLLPPDDEVEWLLSKIIGLDPVKNMIRGFRRTIEMEKNGASSPSRVLPKHLAIVGNPGCGKTFVATLLAQIMHKIGAVPSANIMSVGREELVDRKSESRTIQKTRKVIEKANGGVLFVDEVYTLLPSMARPRGKDFGPSALRELARGLNSGNPLVILAGYSADLQRVLAADIGFKGNFLTRVEIPDPSSSEIARMFFYKTFPEGSCCR